MVRPHPTSPAQFVHPGAASHGDLGMITAADAVPTVDARIADSARGMTWPRTASDKTILSNRLENTS
ncbi:MAG TPA: hypothetical protein DD444_10090 [Citreicella sp.]|jgi:hypothetical protein|nr:hypothetical protein [Citreicella sp.]